MVFAGVSRNTQLAYKTAVQRFSRFRDLYGLARVWPIPESHIVMFIAYCFEKSYSPSSITTYISGLSFFHKINGWYSISDVFVVSKILKGCRRLRPVVDKRAPITLSMLKQICAVVPVVSNSIFESMLFKALFSVAYFGLFRVSKLVFTNNGNMSISVEDIRFDSDQKHVVLCLRTSKTNQSGKPTYLKLPCESDDAICPVCNLKIYMRYRPLTPGQLFIHENGS